MFPCLLWLRPNVDARLLFEQGTSLEHIRVHQPEQFSPLYTLVANDIEPTVELMQSRLHG